MAGSSPSEQVAALAESFVERYRRGERPSVRDYADRHPELAAEIRQVFPAVAMMENVALDPDEPAGPHPLPAATPPVSQVGDFRIVREVGRGGMGVVYEAEQLSLGRFVALKLLPSHTAATDRQRERFLREARAAARLHHTNIVPVFGFGEADGMPYYAMQFICGQGVDAVIDELRARVGGPPRGGPAADLARSLASGEFRPADPVSPGSATPHPSAVRPAPSARSSLSGEPAARPGRGPLWRGVARLGVQVAGALDHAHQLGVLHRDVKPSNLLLDIHGTAWVTDFGLAKTEGQPDLTRDGDVLGTLRYLPPEALDGMADARGDVFALGLCLYELFALRPAYDAPDRAGLLRQVAAAHPPPLRGLAPGLPRDLGTIVHKAIQKEPDRRYPTAAALADDLQRWLDGRPIAARRVSAVGHAWRACKRNPAVSGLAAALAAAVLLGVAGMWWGWGRAVAGERAANEHLGRAEENERAAVVSAEALRRERDEVARLNALAADRLYVADMNRAQLSWYGGNVALVRDLLAAHRPAPGGPDRRGVEWFYLNRLAAAEARVIPCPNRRMPVLVIGPGGDRIASAGADGVDGWTADGRPLGAYRSPVRMRYHYAAAFSPAGDRLLYAENGERVTVLRVLDASTWAPLRAVRVGVEVNALVAAGAAVAGLGTDGSLRAWDPATWEEWGPVRAHEAAGHAAAAAPDGTVLVTAGRGRVNELRVWDARGWPCRPAGECTDGVGQLDCLSVGPGGRRAAGCSGNEVRVFDLAAAPPRLAWRRTCGALRAAVAPDGDRVLVTCTDGGVRVFDAVTGEEVGAIRGHENVVEGVAVAPDGTWAASAGRDRTVRVWPLPYRTPARVVPAPTGHLSSAAVSRDGAYLATAGRDEGAGPVRLWDARTGRPIGVLGTHARNARRVRFSPDGRWLVSAGEEGAVKCWSASNLRADAPPVWEVRSAGAGWLGACDIDIDPGSRFVLIGLWDKTVRLADLATGREIRRFRTEGLANWNVCVRPGGRHVVTACDIHNIDTHPSVIVFDAATGAEVFRLADPQVSHGVPRYSPDGRVLYTSSEGLNVRAWDADTGRPLPVTFKGHTGWVLATAVSPDGRRLLTGAKDGTARVWDTATGHELLTLRGHTGDVRDVGFTPAGDAIVTAAEDRTARIWEAPPE